MKRLLKVSVASCAIAFAAGGGALAQDSSGGAAGGQPEMGPHDVTCATIVALEPVQVERALYYMAGYRAAERGLAEQSRLQRKHVEAGHVAAGVEPAEAEGSRV